MLHVIALGSRPYDPYNGRPGRSRRVTWPASPVASHLEILLAKPSNYLTMHLNIWFSFLTLAIFMLLRSELKCAAK